MLQCTLIRHSRHKLKHVQETKCLTKKRQNARTFILYSLSIRTMASRDLQKKFREPSFSTYKLDTVWTSWALDSLFFKKHRKDRDNNNDNWPTPTLVFFRCQGFVFITRCAASYYMWLNGLQCKYARNLTHGELFAGLRLYSAPLADWIENSVGRPYGILICKHSTRL